MATLFDRIEFDNKPYSKLKDEASRLEVEELVFKLKPLEQEILNSPKGVIIISKLGAVYSFEFAPELAGKITTIVTGAKN